MCMCGKPTINGQPGYSWDGKSTGVRPVNAPALADGDSLVYDEPGRCGGLDSHCHHFRLVLNGCHAAMLVRHGGGDERFEMAKYLPGVNHLVDALRAADTHGRYWILHLLYKIHSDAADKAKQDERTKWASAAIEKRIKVRRRRGTATAQIEAREPALPA
jgi:hypothetical protein